MSTLDARKVAVLGGTGQVGEGICRRLLAAGATVVAVGRTEESLATLAERLGHPERLRLVADAPRTDAAWAAAAERLDAVEGPLDAVVVSIGRWWSGTRMVEMPVAEWEEVLQRGLGSHVHAARAFLPRLAGRKGAAYVAINGSGAEEPVAGSAVVNTSAAAQLMLTRVLALEHKDDVRVHALVVDTPVLSRDRPSGPDGWVSADDVGDAVVHLIDAGGAVVAHLRAGGRLDD